MALSPRLQGKPSTPPIVAPRVVELRPVLPGHRKSFRCDLLAPLAPMIRVGVPRPRGAVGFGKM
jgi:hypothetical protein